MDIPLDLALNIAGLVMPALAVVGGMKWALNGMRRDILDIKQSVAALVKSDSDQAAEIAAITATQESHQGWMERLEGWVTDGLRERRTEPR